MEKAVLVGIGEEDGLREIERLAVSAGAEVLDKFVQHRKKIDPAYYVGKGKAGEIAAASHSLGIGLVIFDAELSPAQQRNLEGVIGLKVIDRTGLILDIFSQRARTSEGKLQVELAQLTHLLPRLAGYGVMMEQLGGGIGTRGPGETRLEYDRRRIRKRITILKREIEEIKKRRVLHRRSRRSPVVSLVGYTNTGKSTLLNKMTNAGVAVDDMLFATLDPTTRKAALPNSQEILITDTVGFIRRLPHNLVVAFRATLEEITQASLLLHVVDVSSFQMEEEMLAVRGVLKEIGAHLKPVITVFNKMDRCVSQGFLERVLNSTPDSVAISALTGEGLNLLQQNIARFLSAGRVTARFSFPYETGVKHLSVFYSRGEIYSKEILDGRIIIEGSIDTEVAGKFEKYRVGNRQTHSPAGRGQQEKKGG